MKKFCLIYIIIVFSTFSYANFNGRIGASVSSNILPNFVNLVFGVNSVSKATEAELKQAEEELALSLQHARTFIADRFSKDLPYKYSILRYQKELTKAKDDIKMASRWETMSDDEKYEYAKNQILKRNPDFKKLNERDYGGNIHIEIKKLNADFSKRTTNVNKMVIERNEKEITELVDSGNKSLDKIVRLIELSPETVSYFYRKYTNIIMRQNSLRRPTLSTEVQDYLDELKTYSIIQEQAHAVALKKKKVNELAFRLAKQKDYSKWVESQNMINLFNSIFLNGYAYYTDYNGQKGKASKYAQINVNRHLGDIVDVLSGPSRNDFATLVNTTTILQAQTIKKVLADLFNIHSLSGDMRSLDFIATPSTNTIYDARRKVIESEQELSNRYGIVQIYGQYKPRALYLELLTISLECDKIVKQALLNNIGNAESAENLYNSKIKAILGNTVTASGTYYYNF